MEDVVPCKQEEEDAESAGKGVLFENAFNGLISLKEWRPAVPSHRQVGDERTTASLFDLKLRTTRDHKRKQWTFDRIDVGSNAVPLLAGAALFASIVCLLLR